MPNLTGTDRYVTTAEIRVAVKGRETDILDRLGIPGRKGNPHVDCPYSDHGGRNDWRWDRRRSRAFCTCIGKRPGEKRSHSIFDVFALVQGVDFARAKIRIAEMIGRSDLIKTKGDGERHQATDATNLLNPPPNNRNDDLPWNYLGYRLGVDPDCVPRPTTRVVGIKALEYFDPPSKARKTDKPIVVVTTPCAVFEQIDRDGNIHAHRTYLAAGGLGKANLGNDANGKPRIPKKSARIIGDDNTSGRSVLWGDPLTATLAILCEGVETASAVALAFQAEIEAGEILVAACINAAGIENFKPRKGTTEVIVAADRDEAAADGNQPASRRGERAARTFGIRHHREFAGEAALPVLIALPGMPGESIDWLDILLRDGVAAVHTGVLGGATFAPTAAEIERHRHSATRVERLQEVIETYPLPHMDRLRVEFRYTRHDEIWVHKFEAENSKPDTDEKSETWKPIASPMGVPALLQMADENDTYGLRVVVQDMCGKPRTVDFERGELARLGASEIRARLFAAGLRVEGEGENICIQFLKAAKPATLITIVSRPGWHRHLELSYPVFITPAGEAIGSPADTPIELAAAVTLPVRVGRSGTIEGWQAAVRAAVTADNCPHWTLSAAAGFAGVLIDLIKLDTCGVNESGETSVGKTTGQQIAVSVWSSPKQSDGGLLKSMRATENAIETLARDSSGTILALDEIAHADGKVIARVIYSLAGDVGKARMRPDSSLRRPHTWSTFALLSGEKALEQKVRDDGGQWTGGMAVRFPDVDVTGVNSRVAPETMNALKQIFKNYGHAGPAFVRALVANGFHQEPDPLRERILTMARTLAGAAATSAQVRAAIPFGVVAIAGSLAQEFGILPSEADIPGSIRWAWERFCTSSDALAIDPDRLPVSNIRRYIAERWDVTIKDVKSPTGVNNREAVGWYDHDTVYLPTNRIAEAAGGVLKEQRIAAVLDQGGHLSRRGGCDADRDQMGAQDRRCRLLRAAA